ncbi:MAG TPA: hypothetical protein DCQ10_12710, partial [Rhodobacteraceae bacterium]|nr:hypothetical protein [Paracoccaceae bacterium]
ASGFVFDDKGDEVAADATVQEGQGNVALPEDSSENAEGDKHTAAEYHGNASDPNTPVFNGGDTAFAASLDPVPALNTDSTDPDQIAKWGYDGYLEGVVPLVASLEGFELSTETSQDSKAPKGFVASGDRIAEESLAEDLTTGQQSGIAASKDTDLTDPHMGAIPSDEEAVSQTDTADGPT